MRAAITVATAVVLMTGSIAANSDIQVDRPMFDFGHVGVAFTVSHNFVLFNSGKQSIRIDSVDIPCECSSLRFADSLLEPGDTVVFRVSLDTKSLYGPTDRQITVFSSDPNRPALDLYYMSVVGQWYDGFKPDPISVFLLPSHKSKTVRIHNREFDEVRLKIWDVADSTIEATVLVEKADKGDALEFEIKPAEGLGTGTYDSNVTVKVYKSDKPEPTLLTIPVKVVKY